MINFLERTFVRQVVRMWPGVRTKLVAAGKVIAERLSSRTFLVVVSAPFTGWGVLLHVLAALHSPKLHWLAASGLGCAFAIWFLVAAVWGALAFSVGRFRHAIAVWMALLVLAIVHDQLGQVERAANRSKASSVPVCEEKQCVAF